MGKAAKWNEEMNIAMTNYLASKGDVTGKDARRTGLWIGVTGTGAFKLGKNISLRSFALAKKKYYAERYDPMIDGLI